ncbi:MAG: hypothetical protein U0165_10975 [Polyangiaceae bacterium]
MVPFHELVYLGLSFIEVDDASCLYDRALHSWLDERCPEVSAVFREDSRVLSSLYRASLPRSRWLHALPLLHDSVASFAASAPLELAQLEARHVSDELLLRALKQLPIELVEIFRADLALVQKPFSLLYDRVVRAMVEEAHASLRPLLDQAREIEPSFDPTQVEPCHSLGSHGRALGRWILVGIPSPWSSFDLATCVIQALHEYCVIEEEHRLEPHLDEQERHRQSERGAIARLSKHITRGPESLREAHTRWLARLVMD